MKDIAFTFGIITNSSEEACQRISEVVHSIRELHVPEYQIVIIGNEKRLRQIAHLQYGAKYVNIIDFDDSLKEKWITRKKNLITQCAIYDNIVYSHDYIKYDINWYQGWKSFGDNFSACMNPITTMDGSRYRDWTIFPDEHSEEARKFAGFENNECLLPYQENSLNCCMYFSGAYWIAKRRIMQELPLNEDLCWGQGEDVTWSQQFREKYTFSINLNSKVYLLKPHTPIFLEMRPEVLAKIKEYHDIKLKS